MGVDVNQARTVHFSRLQQALEDGLKAIESARSPREADAARRRARRRLEELNRAWAETNGVQDGQRQD